ncbi:MAG TPA: glycosyltransferase family 4 protein, partial [Myxococcota bacterium]|nr:glycosyltransferase family 4 protein [Myxococcota bacterium]
MRACALALAIADRRPIQLFLHEPAPAWAPLLSGRQLQRLQALARATGSELLPHPRVWLRSGSSVPPRPPLDHALVLVCDAEAAAPTALARYRRAYAFAPTQASFGLTALPRAVDATVFGRRAPAAAPHVLVIGTGDADDARLVAQITAASRVPVSVFDPHGRASAVPDATVLPPMEPLARAEAFARASVVLTVDPRLEASDTFFWEAQALGIPALTTHLGATPAAWDAESLATALAAHERGDPAGAPLHIVDLEDAVDLLTLAPETPDAPRSLRVERTVIEHRPAGDLPASPAAHAPGAVAVLWVGEGVEWPPEAYRALGSYDFIYIEASHSPAFMLLAVSQVIHWVTAQISAGHQAQRAVPLVRATGSYEELGSLLERHVAAGAPHIHVAHLADGRDRVRWVGEVLSAYADAKRDRSGPLPTLLAYRNKSDVTQPSYDRMGGPVASHNFLAGLVQCTRGRMLVSHLETPPPEAETARTYFYPVGPRSDRAADQVDFGQLPTAFESGNIDAVYVPGALIWRPAMARALWSRRPVPILGMLHSLHPPLVAYGTSTLLLQAPTHDYDTLISPSACGKQAFAGLLEAAGAWLESRGVKDPRFKGRIEVIPYGIDTAYFTGVDRQSARAALSLPADRTIVLSLARFDRREKADLLPLLLACREALRRHPALLLVLAGGRSDARYADEVRQMLTPLGLTEAVRIAPELSFAEKVLMYGAADIFVSLVDNVQETYGLTLLEAMAAGLPVLASEWDGYRELVRHGETGLLVPTLWGPVPSDLHHTLALAEGLQGNSQRDLHEGIVVDPGAIVAALEQLLADPHLRRRMGARGLERVRTDYELERQSELVRALLLDRIDAARASAAPQQTWRPFMDPVATRFAHFATRLLRDDERLRVGRWASDTAGLRTVLSQTQWGSEEERRLAERAVAHVRDTPETTVASLCAALARPPWTRDAVYARMLRC